jgi:hypothetical protein
MHVHASGNSSRFADRAAKLLERVEHRPALCPADREAAYRLRYDAYLRQNLLNPRIDAILYDEVYDESPNSLTTLTYIDGELASTVRLHAMADEVAISPAHDVFPDVLGPLLRRRRVIIEPARLAARPEMARRFPELPYFALRPPWIAAQHFNADHIVLSCASGHESYYRRVYHFETWSGLRSYPKVTAKVVCIGPDFPAERERVEARYPSFRSTATEREALLGALSLCLGPVPTPVGPDLALADVQPANARRLKLSV